MIKRVYYTLRASRLFAFILAHAVVSIAAGAMALKNSPASVHTPKHYALEAIDAFFGSLAGASLSILLLLKWLFFGYAGTASVQMFSHNVPVPILVGVCALLGFGCLALGTKNSISITRMYLTFALASILFMAATNNALSEIGNLRLLAK